METLEAQDLEAHLIPEARHPNFVLGMDDDSKRN